jgi:rRNA maturation endonuclease Nob1
MANVPRQDKGWKFRSECAKCHKIVLLTQDPKNPKRFSYECHSCGHSTSITITREK